MDSKRISNKQDQIIYAQLAPAVNSKRRYLLQSRRPYYKLFTE